MRLLSLSIRLILFVICIGWLATTIEINATLAQFETFHFWAAFAAASLIIPSTLGYSWRLRYLLHSSVSLGDTGRATIIGIVFNIFLPIRGGELIKMIFLSRKASIRFEKALVAVFWERFAELNAALILIITIGIALDLPVMITSIGAAVVAIWILIFALKKYPDFLPRLLRLMPSKKIQDRASSTLNALTSEVSVRRQVIVNVQSVLIWCLLALQGVLVLRYAADLPLSIVECLAVFAIATIFVMIPSAPASIGVMEAGVVLGASWFGIPQDQALAAAILLHLVQLVPVSVVGLSWLIFHNDTKRLLLTEYQQRRASHD